MRRRVRCRLRQVLTQRAMSWGELARRTLLPVRVLARLNGDGANPRLALAERVAAGVGLSVEDIWSLPAPAGVRPPV